MQEKGILTGRCEGALWALGFEPTGALGLMMTLGASSWVPLVGVLGPPAVFGGAKPPSECCDGRNGCPPGKSTFCVA